MRLHLLDGTYELFRAHYSKRPTHLAPDGQDVTGAVGLLTSVVGLLHDPREAVTHIAAAFDNPIESFRNDLFDGYKAGEGLDPVILAQFDLVEEVVAALGIPVWRMARFEADDALATATHRFRDHVAQVRLLTPDKDLGQCVTGNRVVQVDRMRHRVIDEDGVRARHGCAPSAVPDWLALVGDAADGIPGVPRFGAKTAGLLLRHFGSLEAIPTDAAQWPAGVRGAKGLAHTLATRREEAALYKRLATLVEDVPLAESLPELEWRGAHKAPYERLGERLGTRPPPPPRWRES